MACIVPKAELDKRLREEIAETQAVLASEGAFICEKCHRIFTEKEMQAVISSRIAKWAHYICYCDYDD